MALQSPSMTLVPGFSSLGRPQQLEVDRIKIDRSLVQAFGRSKNDEHIVGTIV